MARPKGSARPGIKYLTLAEWRRFQALIKGDPLYDFLFNLTLATASRVTEITTLRLSAVDERARKIQVQGVKGGLLGRYPLDKPLWRRYRRWMKVRAEQLGPLYSPFLFPSPVEALRAENCPISAQAVQGKFKGLIKELGLSPDLSIHSLRHSAAIFLLRSGTVTAPQIQEHLRQRTSDSVMKYLRLFGSEAQEATDHRADVMKEFTK